MEASNATLFLVSLFPRLDVFSVVLVTFPAVQVVHLVIISWWLPSHEVVDLMATCTVQNKAMGVTTWYACATVIYWMGMYTCLQEPKWDTCVANNTNSLIHSLTNVPRRGGRCHDQSGARSGLSHLYKYMVTLFPKVRYGLGNSIDFGTGLSSHGSWTWLKYKFVMIRIDWL